MAHINLLPWRAERRKLREREFYGKLGIALVIGIVVVIIWASWMGRRIDNQNARNAYLQGQIHQLDAKIAKIKSLQRVRARLLDRKHIIERLQSDRSQMVHMFDALVKTIPDSVRLTSLKQNGDHLRLAGVAESNASVAQYMINLAASPWLGSPQLGQTANHHGSSSMPYSFNLSVTLTKPTAAELKAATAAQDTSTPAAATSVIKKAGASAPVVVVSGDAGKAAVKPVAGKVAKPAQSPASQGRAKQ
ncbi:MAG TPA: PilN domain-containing protein [Rhodanobacteraceae bacterium]